jgi:hypothetical protein
MKVPAIMELSFSFWMQVGEETGRSNPVDQSKGLYGETRDVPELKVFLCLKVEQPEAKTIRTTHKAACGFMPDETYKSWNTNICKDLGMLHHIIDNLPDKCNFTFPND